MKFKVIEQTSNHLIFQNKSADMVGFGFISIYFGFTLFIGGSLTVSAFTTGTKTLTCERVDLSKINCKIEINESSNQILVSNLQEARVYPNVSNHSNEVVLLTKTENVIFSENINHAVQINNFVINKNQKYLRISDVNYLSLIFFEKFSMGLLFPSLGMIGFLFIAYSSFAFTRYKFDKFQQIFTLEEPQFTLKKIKQLTLVKHKIYQYPYSEILGFSFEEDNEGDTYYRLQTTEGKTIFSGYTNSGYTNKDARLPDQKDREIINLIMDYGIKCI